MGWLAVVVGNLSQRWRERCAAKIDGRFLRDLDRMSRSAVIDPAHRVLRTPCGGGVGANPTQTYRNLTLVRSARRTALASHERMVPHEGDSSRTVRCAGR